MKQRNVALEIKSLSDDGTFTGMAAVYGNKDLGGDVIDPGAFKVTLAQRGKDVPILWQHNSREPIGLGTLTDSDKGLVIEGKLSLEVMRAKEAYALLKDRVLRGLSIGYETIAEKLVGDTRYLKEVKLFEVSLVTFPMNEMALVSGVKSAEEFTALLKQVEEACSEPERLKEFGALAGKLIPPAAAPHIDPKVCLQSMFEVHLPSLG